MKLIILAFFCLVTARLSAAAPIVVIDDQLNAIVDGSNLGKAGDVIANHKDNAPLVVAVNVALMTKLATVQSTAAASVRAAQQQRDAAIAAKEEEKTAAIAEARAQRDAAIAAAQDAAKAKQDAEAAHAAEAARVGAIVAVLQALPPETLPAEVRSAIRTDVQKRRDALLAQKAALEAELAKP